MSTRSIVAASLLAAGVCATVAGPAQAFPFSGWTEKTYVCKAFDKDSGAPLPDVTVRAVDPVGASAYALPEFGPQVNGLDVRCYEQP
ncbi:hypothetical protein ACFYTF_20095 [Nocardia thailandica]|uniref:Uncharacterized protein n=1 Tax=Nocardia thailandica TaxID=257275 RepID=A0ABW6PRU4_9NOCA